jgi:CheY-like chemotaxis protein
VSSTWILVVDDDEDIRETVVLLLGSKGYDTISAGDGLEALQIIRSRGCPAMVLLDLRMPRMNGVEFAAAVRADPTLAETPIVVFSGDTTARATATSIGAHGLLIKPFEWTELLALVRGVVADVEGG